MCEHAQGLPGRRLPVPLTVTHQGPARRPHTVGRRLSTALGPWGTPAPRQALLPPPRGPPKAQLPASCGKPHKGRLVQPEILLLLQQDSNLLGQTREASPPLSPKVPETRMAPGSLGAHGAAGCRPTPAPGWAGAMPENSYCPHCGLLVWPWTNSCRVRRMGTRNRAGPPQIRGQRDRPATPRWPGVMGCPGLQPPQPGQTLPSNTPELPVCNVYSLPATPRSSDSPTWARGLPALGLGGPTKFSPLTPVPLSMCRRADPT